jgi:hypothetical protein
VPRAPARRAEGTIRALDGGDVRGMQQEAGQLRHRGPGNQAVVWELRPAAWRGQPHREDVRGVQQEARQLWHRGRGNQAVVCQLRQEARRGQPQQEDVHIPYHVQTRTD